MASTLFFEGGHLPEMQGVVDRTAAARVVNRWLRSYAPAHEAKEDTVGYALWVWCEGDLTES